MSQTPEPTPTARSLSPDEIPFHSRQSLARFTTDTGKLLPRKYTHMSAKQQRTVTHTIKRARNLHLMP
jgi:small subunit ribosomal protein S18